MQTGFFSDPLFLKHETGQHPENAGRLEAIQQGMQGTPLWEKLVHFQARDAHNEELKLVHPGAYISQVEEATLGGMPFFGTPDCVISPDTYTVSRHAAGAVCEAVLQVDKGTLDNAFLACRPPGHHAEHRQALGFCFFNNIAVAAALLTQELGYQRVLVFDFDVHHGNGTQHMFEERRDIFYASIHQDPRTCFPGTGYADEKGRGEGLGYTLNVPVEIGAGDASYYQAFEQILMPAFKEYQPDFILLSAGFDAHRDDPLASVNLSTAGFDFMVENMKALAVQTCGGKLVSLLEGGYHYQRLAECVFSHVTHLQNEPT